MSAAGEGPAVGEYELSSELAAATHLSVHLAELGYDRLARIVQAAGGVADVLAAGLSITRRDRHALELVDAVCSAAGTLPSAALALQHDRVARWLGVDVVVLPGGVVPAAARVAQDLVEGDLVHAGASAGRDLLRSLGRGDS